MTADMHVGDDSEGDTALGVVKSDSRFQLVYVTESQPLRMVADVDDIHAIGSARGGCGGEGASDEGIARKPASEEAAAGDGSTSSCPHRGASVLHACSACCAFVSPVWLDRVRTIAAANT